LGALGLVQFFDRPTAQKYVRSYSPRYLLFHLPKFLPLAGAKLLT
jgi:hypothetical protein